jgi:Zn-dependent protease
VDWERILFVIPGIILGLTVHEFCHAFCSYKLGDNTARDQGRLTFNPLKHIDIIGFLFIIFAGFGWAKPVQFDPQQLKNFRRDKALIASAGPVSNMILGIILIYIVKAMFPFYVDTDTNKSVFTDYLFLMLFNAAAINFGLFIFNLIPIPPLDGSHIVFSGLDLKPEIEKMIRKFGMPVLFLILIIQNQANLTIIPIGSLIRAIMNFFLSGAAVMR